MYEHVVARRGCGGWSVSVQLLVSPGRVTSRSGAGRGRQNSQSRLVSLQPHTSRPAVVWNNSCYRCKVSRVTGARWPGPRMTISYQRDVASSTAGGFTRILFKWKEGSLSPNTQPLSVLQSLSKFTKQAPTYKCILPVPVATFSEFCVQSVL